jgi:hypothetical protein
MVTGKSWEGCLFRRLVQEGINQFSMLDTLALMMLLT